MPRSGGQTYEDALTDWLAERDVLLVLDNCEHVAVRRGRPRRGSHGSAPSPSGARDESRAAVGRGRGELPARAVAGGGHGREPVRRSTRVRRCACSGSEPEPGRRHALDTDRAGRLVGEICRRVDGLPLAIELAAARVVGLDLEDISVHLDDLFDLLPQAARRADGAQRSLRATVEWSDALLDEEERQLLRRMAVFAGGFDLAAIKAVCASDGQTAAKVADLTARLVEKSLLLKQDDSGQYQLLETIRQYAVEQLDRRRRARRRSAIATPATTSGRAATKSAATHHRAGAATPRGAAPHRGQHSRCARVPPQRSILAAALELAASLNFFWWTQGRLREGIGWLERGARRRDGCAGRAPGDEPLLLKAFLVAHDTDDWQAAATLVDVGLDALVDVSEPPLILGMLHCLRGRVRRLRRRSEVRRRSHRSRARDLVSYPGHVGPRLLLVERGRRTARGRGRGRRRSRSSPRRSI